VRSTFCRPIKCIIFFEFLNEIFKSCSGIFLNWMLFVAACIVRADDIISKLGDLEAKLDEQIEEGYELQDDTKLLVDQANQMEG
jgi:hypothetical protein